jgi:hypothetical protein
MTFAEFRDALRTGTIENDAAWRAYDLEGSMRPIYPSKALKRLGLAYAGELAIPEFMARYGYQDREQAVRDLGLWWLWNLVDDNRYVVGLKLRGLRP